MCQDLQERRAVAYLVADLDLIMEGKRYVRTCSHRPVDSEEESPTAFGAEVLESKAKKSKDTAEEDMTMKE